VKPTFLRVFSNNTLNHGEVFVAAVRVKQHVAQGQLEDNTAHRPDVARMGPACAKKNIKNVRI
jgi:hypothetical protein